MKVIALLICLAILVAASGCGQPAGKDNTAFDPTFAIGNETTSDAGPVDNGNKDGKPNFTIGKETTLVTGPIRDGYIDYGAALNERLGKGIAPETNAYVLLWKALGPTPTSYKRMPAEFFKLLGMEEPPAMGDYFVALKNYLREQLKIDDAEQAKKIEEQLSDTARYPWSAKDYPQIAEWLKANEKSLALVVEASKRPNYFSPLGWGWKRRSTILGSIDPVQTQSRELARALASRALLKVNDGKHDEAWQDLLACHRLARLAGRSTPFFRMLVGLAIDQIAGNGDVAFLDRAEMNADQIQACVRDLRALPPIPSFADCIDVGERFEFLDEMMMFAKHGFWYVVQLTPAERDYKNFVDEPVKNINWDPGLHISNQWFDRFVATLRGKDRPTRQQCLELLQKEFNEQTARLRSDDGKMELRLAMFDLGTTPDAKGKLYGEVLISLLMPAVQKYQVGADRAEQNNRNLYVAFALAAYKSDNKSYPKALDALAPKYLPKVPDDLFTGKPLVYRPAENGYLLYSLGPDGKDDEGRGTKDEPKGDDITIRIPVAKLPKK